MRISKEGARMNVSLTSVSLDNKMVNRFPLFSESSLFAGKKSALKDYEGKMSLF